jgi:hypothetical protein
MDNFWISREFVDSRPTVYADELKQFLTKVVFPIKFLDLRQSLINKFDMQDYIANDLIYALINDNLLRMNWQNWEIKKV